MAGIVEAGAGPPPYFRPLIKRLRLGAAHVGFEAAQPEQTRRGARALAHGDDTRRRAGSYLQGFKAIIHSLAFAIRRWLNRGRRIAVFRLKPAPNARGSQDQAQRGSAMADRSSIPVAHSSAAKPLPRTLADATILQIVPSLRDEPAARVAVQTAIGLLQSGARALVAGAPGCTGGEITNSRWRMGPAYQRHDESLATAT